ncbi:polysaccharide deacetylase family protein [Teredinibacter franksiae]|uniref:polysaccharide deacetylase family protein n=1 Tax=Teredinibacter franksiae TaxID=2761453 RepID=UPI0028A5FAA8|nr:polysaccharide deacetylase family protein [Teredinibacter franksiae]
MIFNKLIIFITAMFCLALFALPAHALVVLQYHHISDQSPPATSTSPALFEAHLNFLQEQNISVLSIAQLPELLQKAQNGSKLPDRAVMITFDDGYRSIYNSAYPLLKKRGWPFAVFVNSKPHDEKNPLYMSWKQMREMAAHQAIFANHSDSHPHFLRRRGGESFLGWQQRRMNEIVFAQKRLAKELDVKTKLFAHPYGEYDENLLQQLEQLGYLAFGQQSGPIAAYSHPQLLPRFPMGGRYGRAEDFAIKVFSLPFPRLKATVKDSKGRSLKNPELPEEETLPVLTLVSPVLRFAENAQCFASGQGAIHTKLKGGGIQTVAIQPLKVGRSRYNCTVQAGGGRYYWYSQMFIRRNVDGSWYRE